jgi:isoleucyl-tRNA synthetase
MKRKDSNASGFPEYAMMDLPTMEKEILTWWEENNVFEKSISERPDDKRFVFFEGPPSANGLPGIHHVMSRTIKDLFCRFKTLQGYRVERKAGWDTHGLPVELGVEKKIGITKADIGTKITVAEYNKLCREDVMKFTDIWNDLTRKMGYWVDMEHPYITYENNYIESLWALLKKLFDKGLLYEGYTIQPYSPAAGTGLSSHELNQPGCYRDVKDVSAIAQFKVAGSNPTFKVEGDVFFLAWTTTPWTLPSNTALAVGKEIEYVLVKTFNAFTHQMAHVILAKDLMGKYFPADNAALTFDEYKKGDKKIPFSILASFKGADLEGIRYEQLLPYAQPTDGDAFRVILGDFVTTTDGTGIVHIAPSFGSDDFRVAKQNSIGSLTLVDKQGKFVDEVNDPVFPLDGRYVKEAYFTEAEKEQEFHLQKEILRVNNIIADLKSFMSADDLIVLKLKLENKLFKTEKYDHSYPHCWRTDKPIIYYPLDSWFIKTTAIKERLIELNKTINWKPAHTGEGRFGQWLENLVDWNLSRSRYWGTPLPIWVSEDNSEVKCIGSIDELKSEMIKSHKAGFLNGVNYNVNSTEYFNQPAPKSFEEELNLYFGEISLHKPYVDEIVLVSDTGKPMKRVADLIDVWFDSGAMPYAQWHYPLENESTFKQNFPADFIAEGVDQTRGWFFTLHVLGVALFDSVAYKNVVSNGLLLDKNGNKMSKRLGNVIDPFETIEKYSADATRWYMMRNSDPWENMKFDMTGLQDVIRSHFGTLYNTYGFFALYANIDNWKYDAAKKISNEAKPELDRWIISKLQTLVKDVTGFYEDYEPTKAARAIEKFVDEDLSNWYVRLNRRRFWKGEMSEDKQAAYETLFECLNAVSQLMSPIAPFFSEWMHRNLNEGSASVHLSYLVKADERLLDKDLEERMELAQRSCSLILSLRKKEKIKVRQPLSKILIPVVNAKTQAQFEKVESYILSEVNVKAIEYISDASGVVKKKIKPNFKELGKRVGSKMKAVQNAVLAFTADNISQIERDQKYVLNLEGESFELFLADVDIQTEDIPGWLVASEGALTVALDVTLTDALRQEGNAREFVNKVQNLRKDKDFKVLDRIKVKVIANDMLKEAIVNFHDYIANEILAKEIEVVDTLDSFDELEYNEETIKVFVAVV